jgi:glycosyltransferase involved in cell wall biosynthesis
MTLGIIIPTKNEAKALPYLVSSIKKQTYKNYEIIVSDHPDSKDGTKSVARSYGCDIVRGGCLSTGRNRGAEIAIKKGLDTLMWVDADAILPSESFLEKALEEFYERNLDLAGTLQIPYDSNAERSIENVIETCKKSKDWRYNALYDISNWVFKIQQNRKLCFMQNCMFARSELYKKEGGFDETIEFGEDSHYAQRIARIGKYNFGILETPGKVLMSSRRLETKGFWKMAMVYAYFNTGRVLGHEFRIGKSNYYQDTNF